MKATLHTILGLALACAGAASYGQLPVQGPDTGASGITLTNGGGGTISNPVPARLPLLPPPLTEMDLAASGVLRPVAATNTAPGAPEQYVVSTFNKEIRAVPGGAIADYGSLHVQFPLDAASPVHVTTPEGRSLSFRATLLVATDRSTGDSYPLGAITNATGEITGPSEVTFSQAFDALDADLVYRYDGNRFEQFVVLRQNLDLPDGVNAEDLNMECWTEFFNTPPVSTTTQVATLRPGTATSSAVQSTDLFADFGAVKLLPGGKAFSFGDETNTAPVGKAWADVADNAGPSAPPGSFRRFLVEMVDLQTIQPMLSTLPKPQKHASLGTPRHSREALLASASARPSPVIPDGKLMAALARAAGPKPGVVIDFALGTSVPVPPNIVSWWKAENNANDSINSLNGTLLNGAGASASGKVGAAFSIGGGTQCVQVPNNALLNFSAAMTLECWVYLDSYPNNDIVMIAGKDDSSVHQYQLTLCHYQNQRWCYQPLIVVPGGFAYFPGTIVAQTGTWTHLAMTYDGTALRLYVNGVADGSIAATGAITSTTDPFRIGGYGTGPWTMNGRVDELGLYSRALSPGEIKSISDAGSAGKGNPGSCRTLPANAVGWWPGDGNTSDIAKGHAANLVDGATFSSGAVGQGFGFDGVNAYAEVPNNSDLNPTTGLTIEAWVYQTGGLYQNMPIITKDGCYSDRQYFFTVASSGKFRAHISTDRLYYFDSSCDVELNTWYHVAMTYDGSWLRLYVNGDLNGCCPVSGSIITTPQPLRIGGSTSDLQLWGNYKFQGIIDEPTVFSRALGDQEIWEVYQAGIAGKCKSSMPDATVTVLANSPSAKESGLSPGSFTISRQASSQSSPLVVNISVGGTATPGTDYVPLPGTVTIPSGQPSVSLNVTPLDDNQDEPDETVVVTITPNGSAYTVGSPASATVTILDKPTVTVTATAPQARESGPVAGTFTVTRQATDLASALTVNFAVSGTASAGSDYTALGSTMVIPATQVSAAVTVTPIDDAVYEPDETVVLTINANGSYNVGTPSSSTVTIVDNDWNADNDHDGLPDGWEVQYWGNTTSHGASDDPDLDGLTNLQEYRGGYDPTDADSDHDGIRDGYEDADLDGLANLMESAFGTDPWTLNNDWKQDTDGDGLPDAYESAVSGTNPNAVEASPQLPSPLDKAPL